LQNIEESSTFDAAKYFYLQNIEESSTFDAAKYFYRRRSFG